MNLEHQRLIRHMGFGDKAAKAYLAAVGLGECSVQELAHASGVKRTSLYYVLEELLDSGALFQVQREKKVRYVPELPATLLKRARQQLEKDEEEVEKLGTPLQGTFRKPHIYFLYGPKGFKKIWDMVFASPAKEFRIVTGGTNFLDFVKEKYIIDHIIRTKRAKNIKSKQIIVDSTYARSIVAKDSQENRQSRFLPASRTLAFTEIITESFVAFISPRLDNTLFVVENAQFAETHKQLFESMWEQLPYSPTAAR